MIAKPFATAFFLLCLLWLGSIFVTSNDQLRMERTCAPVGWIGKLSASVMSLASPDLETATHKTFKKGTDSCQYVVYRQFYSDEDSARANRIRELEAEIARREAEIAAQQAAKQGAKQP